MTFEEYYNECIVKHIKPIQQERIKYLYYYLSFLFGIPLLLYIMIYVGNIYHFEEVIIIFMSYICFFLWVVFIFILYNDFTNKLYKNSNLEHIIADYFNVDGNIFNFYPSFNKSADLISNHLLNLSQLFTFYMFSKTDDQIYYKYKDVDIVIMEKELFNVINTGKYTYTQKVFRGLIILCDMNKKFYSQTIIKNKKFNGKSPYHKILLEDVNFNKMYNVYSHDEVEARYILTTGFMERYKKLKDIFNTKNIGCSFFDNKVMFAIGTNKDMFFKVSLFRSINYKTLKRIVDEIEMISAMIDVLSLDKKL